MDRSKIEQILESCEFFKGLEKSDIRRIATLCHIDTYDGGEYVFRQGDFGEYLYVIAEGQISLERSVDLGTRTGSAVIGILGKGRVFGCWSTLLDGSYNYMSSALCQKPTKALLMKGEDLRQMMLDSKTLGFRVLERLCLVLRSRIEGAYGAMEKI